MQTFKNNKDVAIKSYPQSLAEWQKPNPEIKFTVARDRIVHPGDRLFMASKMIKEGVNSGHVVEIYYYIQAIKEVKPNPVHITDTDIVATAKRLEL